MTTQTLNETASSILDSAERLTQTEGFNAFSYRDLQREVGIKTSSIHYYFPAKQDLARALIDRYSGHFMSLLDQIDLRIDLDPIGKLNAMAQIFVDVADKERMCLCGMLSAEMLSLPDSATGKLTQFFEDCEAWISKHIEAGQKNGDIAPSLDSKASALVITSTLEGAVLIARLRKDPDYIRTIAQHVIAQLKAN